MREHLLDTSLLIDFSLGVERAVRFVESISESAVRVHPVAAAEVIAGARSRDDLRNLDELLGRFRRIRVQPQDFDHTLALSRLLSLAHGVGWPDCLIAASALRLGLPVATLNDKHFGRVRGLRVVRPY